jgi:hypothetical protein
MVHGCGWC